MPKEVIAGLCFILPLQELRNTPNVKFHEVLESLVKTTDAVDRVEHAAGAFSPSAPGSGVERPWYMHPDQEDNLMVMRGRRIVELYSVAHGKLETFEVTPDYVKHGETMIYEGPCIFGWPQDVFHRVHSPEGSLSINFARHFEGFDIESNFNIYDLNVETGDYKMIREGHLDQPVLYMGE